MRTNGKLEATVSVKKLVIRVGSRAAATSKTERFVIIVNGWKPLTIFTKHSILEFATALDPPLIIIYICTGGLSFLLHGRNLY